MIKLPAYPWCLPNISDFQCSISSFLSWITSKMAVLSFDLNTFLQNSFSWQGLLQVMILKAEVSCNIFFWKERHLSDFSFYPKLDRYLLFILQTSLHTNFLFMLESIIELLWGRSLITLTRFWPLLTTYQPMLTLTKKFLYCYKEQFGILLTFPVPPTYLTWLT